MGVLRDSMDAGGRGRSPYPVRSNAAAAVHASAEPMSVDGEHGLGVSAAAPEQPSQAPTVAMADPPPAPRSQLERRRDELAEQVTELHWDLGGLAYEMAIRDHFRLDVLVRRAAVLQQRDAELAEVERLLRMESDGVAGHCATCSAPHSRGALYCWQCGAPLLGRLPSAAAALDE